VSDITIAVGESVDFSGTGTDPENDLPLTYRWSFGAGSGLADVTDEDPGLKQFNNPGSFTVTYTVNDAAGLGDPTPAVRLVTVQGGAPVEPLPQTNWSVWSVDSEELTGEDGAASNAFDGDPATIWHTKWKGGSPTPPHELQISLGERFTISGLRYLPRQDANDNGRIRQYEIYVSTDGANWGTAVASGTFADTAAEQEVAFAPVPATHVRLVALNSHDVDPWTSLAELNVLGDTTSGSTTTGGTTSSGTPDPVTNSVPLISGTPASSVVAGSAYSFQPTATDADGDPLSFSISNKPAWAEFSSSTGQLSGSPDSGNVGIYDSIVIRARDGTVSTSLPAFSIQVQAAPVQTGSLTLQWTAPVSRTDGTPLSLADIDGYHIYYGVSAENYTNRLDVSDGTAQSATITDIPVGTYYVVMTTYDVGGLESAYSSMAVKTVP
jgi:hypothetical protein